MAWSGEYGSRNSSQTPIFQIAQQSAYSTGIGYGQEPRRERGIGQTTYNLQSHS